MRSALVILALFLIACDGGEPAESSTGLRVGSVTLNTGNESFLKVEVTGVTRLCEAHIVLEFDPNVVEIVNVTAGALWGQHRGTVVGPFIREEIGKIDVTIGVAEGYTLGVDNSGEILRLHVKGLSAGVSSVAFEKANCALMNCDLLSLVIEYFQDGAIIIR